jgi:hypothetical protein
MNVIEGFMALAVLALVLTLALVVARAFRVIRLHWVFVIAIGIAGICGALAALYAAAAASARV